MKTRRSIWFGVFMWVSSFVIYLVGNAVPGLKPSELGQYIFFWLAIIPLTLLLSKWYFKADPPSTRKGFFLGLTALAVGVALDVLFFTASGRWQDFWLFYGNIYFWLAVVEIVLLCAFAGWEYDRTYTKREKERLGQ